MKPETLTVGKSQVAYKILAYLTEHPKAQDTLEGIVEWWLLEQKIKRRIAEVKKALAELVTKGLVVERKGKDSRSYYRINRLKYREISDYLKRRKGYE